MNAVVKSQHGEVRGSSADGVHTFKGIPYAAPPFGPNRLQPPQPVEAWSGVREALTYGPKPPQLPYPRRGMCSFQSVAPSARIA
jgi:para-nitrobenzyl esterase